MTISAVLLTLALLGPPEPPPGAPLPWALPSFPSIVVPEMVELNLPEPAHSAEYEERVEEAEESVEMWMAPLTAVNSTLDTWIGSVGYDEGSGDIELTSTEFDTAAEAAAYLGEQVGYIFDAYRTLREMAGPEIATFLDVLLICIVLIVLINLFIFTVQVCDMLVSLTLQTLQAVQGGAGAILGLLAGA